MLGARKVTSSWKISFIAFVLSLGFDPVLSVTDGQHWGAVCPHSLPVFSSASFLIIGRTFGQLATGVMVRMNLVLNENYLIKGNVQRYHQTGGRWAHSLSQVHKEIDWWLEMKIERNVNLVFRIRIHMDPLLNKRNMYCNSLLQKSI